MNNRRLASIGLPILLSAALVGCGMIEDSATAASATAVVESTSNGDTTSAADTAPEESTDDSSSTAVSSTVSADGSLLDTTELFTERDMEQAADLTEATEVDLVSGQDVTITEEGVYVVTGQATDATIIVEADDEAKVQIVLDGVEIENSDAPAIYVKSADKVFVTTTTTDNSLTVTGAYEADGETNLDAVIFSRDDLVLNGTGTLTVYSAQGNGVTSKDDLGITGGTYSITAQLDGLEANDSIRIADGDITIVTNKDALHSENEDDPTLGFIYIAGGTLNITAADDAIRGTSIVQIDGGVIDVDTSYEGIEATQIQINGGEIDIYASDDAVNATSKSSAYSVMIEINGGSVTVAVGSGDTDGFDANGSLSINGGTVDVSASSAFDVDGAAELNGGTVTVNGQVVDQITVTQMGGGGRGGGRP